VTDLDRLACPARQRERAFRDSEMRVSDQTGGGSEPATGQFTGSPGLLSNV
jgi:hypothetical protein